MCPFCGKSFKRLKSHLPHCKAVKGAKATSPRHEETKMSSSSSLPPPGPDQTQHYAKTETSTQKMSLDTKEVKTSKKSSSMKKTKLKLSDQIKLAAEMSSPASIASSPNSASKSKKKIPTSRQNNKEVIEKIGTDFEKLGFNQTAKPTIEKRNVDTSQTASKKELKDILTKKTSSNKAKVTVNDVKASPKDQFWSGEEENKKSLLKSNMWTSRQDAKITLHDVRATLGRAKQNGRQKNSSFVDKLPTDEFKCEKNVVPSQVMVLPPGKSKLMSLKSGNLMSELLKIESTDCNFTQRADILKDGLQMDCHTMGLTALSSPARTFLEAEVSTKAFGKDSVLLLKPNEQKAKREMKETRRDLGKQDGGRLTTREAVSKQQLGQVMLRELPDWLVSRCPRRPRDTLQMVQRGWQWYHRKYIDVKKGGVGGVAMLLAGYCVLSYVWCYPHLKRERWRKYH